METVGGLRAAFGTALAVDPEGFQPFVALRAAAGVVIPVAIGTAVGHPAEGAVAAAGALPAGVAGIGGGFRSRANLILATALGMTISTFVGSLAAGHIGPTLIALVVWGFGAGIAVVLGQEATIVGTQAVMGLVVFGRFPGTVEASAIHAAWVFAGAGLQGLLAATLRSPQRFTSERRTLSQAYAELALLARDPARSSLSAASEAAMSIALIGRRAPSEDVDILRGLADEANRIRLEIQSLATTRDVATIDVAATAAADWLDRIAAALRAGHRVPDEIPRLSGLVDGLRTERQSAPLGRDGTALRYAAARSAALLGQLRAVDRLTNALAGVRRLVLPHHFGAPVIMMLPQRIADSARELTIAAKDTTSSAFRHAIRLAVVLPLTEVFSHLLPWQRGYWITLTAVVVLKPDYAATAQRGLARVGGTGLGVLVSGVLIVAFHPSGAAIVILIAVAAWAAYTCFAASYALYSFAVTAIVVLLLAPLGGNQLSTVADRGLDTLVGGAIAMVAYAIWPTWERHTLADATARLLTALAAYAELLLTAYVDPAAAEVATIGDAAAAARRARIAALASFDRAAAEPLRAGADLDEASGVLSASRRIAIELNALRATVEDATELIAVPEVAGVRDSVAASLRALAAKNAGAVGELRVQQEWLAAEATDDPGSLRSRRRALVAAHLDPLVDSIDTLAHVLTPL